MAIPNVDQVWADFNEDGSVKEPDKQEIRRLLRFIQAAAEAGEAAKVYPTKAAMDADLSQSDGTTGLIYADPVDANNYPTLWYWNDAGNVWVMGVDRITPFIGMPWLSFGLGQKLIIDRSGFLSGQAALNRVFVPRTMTIWRGAMINNAVTVANAASAYLATHCELTIDATGCWLIYYDASDNTMKRSEKANWTLSIGGSNQAEIYPLAVINGGQVWSAFEFDDIYDSQRPALSPRGPIIVDTAEAVAYIPWLRLVQGTTPTTLQPPAVGTPAAREAYFRVSLQSSATAQRTHYWDPVAANVASTDIASWPLSPGNGEYVLGRSWFTKFASDFPIISNDGAGFAANMLADGKNPVNAPLIGANNVSGAIVDAALIALGFTAGLQIQTPGVSNSVFAGINLSDTRPGQQAFVRLYVEVGADNVITDPALCAGRALIYRLPGILHTTVNLAIEQVISARAAIFSGSFVVPATSNNLVASIAAGVLVNTATATRITGVQIAVGSRAAWIRHGDYPLTLPGGASLNDVDVPIDGLYGPDLWLTEGRPTQIYAQSLMAQRSDGGAFELTLKTLKAAESNLPYIPTDVRGTLEVDPDRCGATGAIVTRRLSDLYGAGPKRHYEIPVNIRVAPSSQSGTIKVMCLGDSLTAITGYPRFMQDKLAARGLTATLVGTINGTIPDTTGNFHEGRSGRMFADYAYEVTTNMAPVVSPAAYMALSGGDKANWNPLLRAATGGDDPTLVFNGYTVDFAQYFAEPLYSVPIPDICFINLGTNDITIGGASLAGGYISHGLHVLVTRLREAAPNCHIVLAGPTFSRQLANEDRWNTLHVPLLLKPILAFERASADTKLWVMPAWAHIHPTVGFTRTILATDSATGQQSADIDANGLIHYSEPAGAHQFAELAASVVGWIKANP